MNSSHTIPRCYLGSRSPARAALLISAGYEVVQVPVDIDENIPVSDPIHMTRSLSGMKMHAWMNTRDQVLHRDSHAAFVLTADTLIHIHGSILGKPPCREAAKDMLHTLSGRTHEVVSAFTMAFLHQDRYVYHTGHDSTSVTLHKLSPQEIEWYLDTEEWVHAAGAYRIQGRGIQLISSLEGSYFTIVGLPITKISGIVRDQMHH